MWVRVTYARYNVFEWVTTHYIPPHEFSHMIAEDVYLAPSLTVALLAFTSSQHC